MPDIPRLRRTVTALVATALAACGPIDDLLGRKRHHDDGGGAPAHQGPRATRAPGARPHAEVASGPAAGKAFAIKHPNGLAPALHVDGPELVDEGGKPVALHGLNYFGFNDKTGGLAGLWSNDPVANDFANIVLRQKLLGFNAVRLPFSFQDLATQPRDFGIACQDVTVADIAKSILDDEHAGADLTKAKALPNPPDRNPGQCNHYLPMTTLRDQYVWVAQFYVANGFYVLLDNHFREDQTATADTAGWARSWAELVRDVLAMPGAEGRVLVDLLNEPGQHGVGWDTGAAGGVHRLYLAAMDAIHEVSAKVPLVIEGTGQDALGANWGDGYAAEPGLVRSLGLGDPMPFFSELAAKPYAHNVVLGPHVYGPAVTGANNADHAKGQALYDRLNRSFGGQMVDGIKAGPEVLKFPVLIGEFGSKFEPPDADWLRDFSSWLRLADAAADGKHLAVRNWFYWSWNPNSGDTGGLVADDWRTMQWAKIKHLQTLGLTPFYADATPAPAAPVSNAASSTSTPAARTEGLSAPTAGSGAAPPKAPPAAPAPSASASAPTGGSPTPPPAAPGPGPSAPSPTAATPAAPAGGQPPQAAPSPASKPETPSASGPARAQGMPDAAPPKIKVPPAGQPAPPSTPAAEGSSAVEVQVDLSGDWHTGGKHFASLNLYLTNASDADIGLPYELTITNPAYRELGMAWNLDHESLSLHDGQVKGRVNADPGVEWQVLKAHRANTVPLGFLVSGEGDNLTPVKIEINGKPCRVQVVPRTPSRTPPLSPR